jgi:hypothetical protein
LLALPRVDHAELSGGHVEQVVGALTFGIIDRFETAQVFDGAAHQTSLAEAAVPGRD